MSEQGSEFDAETALTVGKIVGPHGLHGDLKVQPLTDFPERFEPGATVWLHDQPVTIEKSRWHGRLVHLKLAGIDTRPAAEDVRGSELLAPPVNLDEGLFYQHDLIGIEVRDTSGEVIGNLTEIMATGANDVYVVRGSAGELLLPAIDDTVLAIKPADGFIVVDIPEGLGFKQRRPSPARRLRRRSPT